MNRPWLGRESAPTKHPYVRVWEYDVSPGRRDAFVTAYGADGDWAQLFRRARGYVGTELYRNADAEAHFVTVDRWTHHAPWLDFLEQWGAVYRTLGASLTELTLSQRRLVESPQPLPTKERW